MADKINNKPKVPKRIKKEKVTSEQSQDWLKRHDQGDTIKDISKKYGYDVRTVSRHIKEAEQERDRRNARLKVLQNALEGHYKDLNRLAQKIELEVKHEKPISLQNERMWAALRQHMPRSPLWSYLKRWDGLIQEVDTLQKRTKERLRQILEPDALMNRFMSKNADSVNFMVIMLMSQMEAWARGQAGLDLQNNYSFETQGDGSTSSRYGSFFLNKISESESTELKLLIIKYEGAINGWDEFKSFSKIYQELEVLKIKIGDEIAIITLRRVVPGKCLYCPL